MTEKKQTEDEIVYEQLPEWFKLVKRELVKKKYGKTVDKMR